MTQVQHELVAGRGDTEAHTSHEGVEIQITEWSLINVDVLITSIGSGTNLEGEEGKMAYETVE